MNKIIIPLALLTLICQGYCGLENAECSKYYEFQTGLLFKELMTDKATYYPGEEATISYILLSQMKAPIVEGTVRVQVFYVDKSDGDQIIDEYFAAKDINMMQGDAVRQRSFWKVPKTAKAGTYLVKTYFIVGDYFNLAGISVLPYGPPGIPGDVTSFNVSNTEEYSRVYLSKKDTTVNDAPYEFARPAEIHESGDFSIKTRIVNEGPAKRVTFKANVYEWADLVEKPLKEYVMEKEIDLPANGSHEVSYNISGLDPSAYEIRLSAESEDVKSLMKLRLPVTGVKGRFIYTGIDKFPLSKDQEVKIFACYSGSTDYGTNFNGTIKVQILDAQGNILYDEISNPMEIRSTPPQGKDTLFKSPKDLNQLTLKAEMYDDKNNLQDSVTMTYDNSRFPGVRGILNLTIAKKTFSPDEDMTYTITYTDSKGIPLRGKMVTYLTDLKGKILDTTSSVDVNGQYSGKFNYPGGIGVYKITARETLHDLMAETILTVSDTPETTIAPATLKESEETKTTMEITPYEEEAPKKDNNQMIAAGILFIAAIAILLFIERRKKK
jgi:hypothetical protein